MKKINLTQGKVAIVDDEDFILLSTMRWWVQKFQSDKWYALTFLNKKPVFMQHFLVNPPYGYEIDHRDSNGLNNCKINLRVCSHAQNMANRKIHKNNKSGFKGVSELGKNYVNNRWRASIRVNTRTFHLGHFKTSQEAAIAYDNAAIKYFGEFAKTNRIMGLLESNGNAQ